MKRTLALASFALSFGAAAGAHATPIDDGEYDALTRGELVRRALDFDLPGGDYFGGVAYVVIDAPADDVMRALLDPTSYRTILPLTLDARVVDKSKELFFLQLTQGGKVGTATYTVVVRRESPRLVRFWLDPARPHEIADCWGFFEAVPVGPRTTLLRYGALVHLDFGVTKLLFSERIRGYALDTPDLVRRHVEARAK